MIAASNRFIISFFSAILIISVVIASVFQLPSLLWAPACLLLIFYLLHHPQYLFYILLISIPWSIEFSFNDSLGTDIPDEPLMLLTALAGILLWVSAHHCKQVKLHPLIFILIIQFVWTLFTVITSGEIIFSIKYILAKSWYILAFVTLPITAGNHLISLKKAITFLFASMMTVLLVVLIRHAQYQFTFEFVNKALEPFFRNHVNYSALLVCMVPIEIACLQLVSVKRKKTLIYIFLAITILGVFLSYARGAWLALVLGMITYWLIKKRLLLVSYIFFFLFCTGFIIYIKSNDHYLKYSNDYKTTIFHKDFKEHLISTYELKDVSTAERFYRWIAAVRMMKDSWITGFGPTTFYYQYKSYTLPAFKTWVSKNEEHSTVHNYFLLLFTEQGLFGMCIFIILFGCMLAYVQKIYHGQTSKENKVIIAATGSVLIMILTVIFLSDLIETDKLGSIFYLCLSFIVIIDRNTKTSDPSSDIKGITKTISQ